MPKQSEGFGFFWLSLGCRSITAQPEGDGNWPSVTLGSPARSL